MRWLLFSLLCVLLLAGCATTELPPNPPPPGGDFGAGRAMGGVSIPSTTLPKWAAPIKHSDISPTIVKANQTVTVTVQKPSGLQTKFFVYATMYGFNQKFRFWEKATANIKKSGKIHANIWVEDKAVFSIPVDPERFTKGLNYLVVYWCIDTGNRDDDGYKIWDCNNQKWGLGAFTMQASSLAVLFANLYLKLVAFFN